VPLTRRALIMLGATAALAGPTLAACGSSLSGVQLRVATGGPGGVYFTLGSRLADVWQEQLGMTKKVLQTNGSVDNLGVLRNNAADVAFVAADAAARGSTGLRALARIYDDYIQVLVRSDSPIQKLADLRGHAVSIGSLNSGVTVVARNLLKAAGLPESNELYKQQNLRDSLADLVAGRLDALFWSGGLPTPDITAAMKAHPNQLRMLDLTTVNLKNLTYYNVETVPATAYPQLQQGDKPVSTLAVHNLLMVREDMPADEAQALLRTLFDAQPDLATDRDQVVALAAQLIDRRSAIETRPIQLHDGALEYYRSAKV
jgi:TRAP transporter TAXI family solute receptor